MLRKPGEFSSCPTFVWSCLLNSVLLAAILGLDGQKIDPSLVAGDLNLLMHATTAFQMLLFV